MRIFVQTPKSTNPCYQKLIKGKQVVTAGTEATLAEFWKTAGWKNGTKRFD